MKTVRITIFALSLILFWTCEKDQYQDYEAPDTLSDATWVIGINQNSQNPFSINYDTHISFFDLSQGTVSHKWEIQDGNHYLKEDFDPGSETLEQFIDNEVGLEKTTPKAHVFFRNSGLSSVRLLNKFNEPVTYNSSTGPVHAIQEGNLWVMDTTFVFDVFGQIKPVFKVLQDGVEILNVTEDDLPTIEGIDSWPTVDVEAGSALTFMDLTTTGRPSGSSWRFPEGTPDQVGGATANVSFFQLGTFTGEMRSFRQAPDPNATEIKLIPLKVNVIPSSQPFVFSGQLKEAENETISFQVNGEVVPFSGQEANFTVNVSNAETGFNQVIPVQSAVVNSTNATFIELTLTQPIYNSDTITVTYNNATDGITSTDTRVLQSFGPENVQMFFGGNILPGNSWASFELTGGNATNALASNQYWIPNANGGNSQFADLIWERVTTNAFDGDASMRYKIPASATPIPTINLFGFGIADGPNGVSQGTYRVSYKVFKENSTLTTFRMEFGFGGGGQEVLANTFFDISSIPNNEWVEVSETLVVTADLTSANNNYRTTLRVLAADNPGVTGEQLLYFDDLSLVELEPRP